MSEEKDHGHMADRTDIAKAKEALAKLRLKQEGRQVTPAGVAETISETEQNKGEARYED
ncbi:MAG: hypothetical protein UY13_C0002G0028 [Candidatus Pacebacteria bacterium GW2011_GWB1_47_8]|nr:MAG: hypothetical protein UX28_C0001G0176 [Candidatus Pacebacteria bacterium GW2011_GWA1_46_10]KKU84116.1 MAG: hypothetical protein UY13_C0002G0028 [Candidatus Pacebacteria bacterium GW2011_GWB1_47_8]